MRVALTLMAAAALTASGCANRMPNHQPTVTPEGKAAWSTQCNNHDQTFGNCVQSARIICGGDFVEVRRTEFERGHTNKLTGATSTYPVRTLEYICAAPEKNPPPM